MPRTAAQIRQEFIDFFAEREHAFVPGAPVVPYDDPTLLFTNAGMNQFKDVFLGTGSRPYSRAANSQPCIRAGGKHNDLDDVGHDTYHHTFFEMLGNWSFGDYFKREAIAWAWELLTEVWGLEKQRLHATYFGGDEEQGLEPDYEARDLWKEISGLPDDHIHPGNMKDNFWEMGETGPCGPCSEVHIDVTPDISASHLVNAGDARVIEIWNLVFIQFNRAADGVLSPLPARHVDTGMGFERLTALLQGKSSNYDTDVFAPIFKAIREVTGAPAYASTLPVYDQHGHTDTTKSNMVDVAYRVIADHVRTLTFAIADGCLPDREGRGYVLRRILRRGVRYGWQYMNMHEPFLCRLVPAVVESLGDAFPKLKDQTQQVIDVIEDEEQSFDRTLERGIALFEEAAQRAADHRGEIRGDDAFKLHDTYGFPIDLTELMAQERGMSVDIGEYERLMEEARIRARTGGGDAAEQEAVDERLLQELVGVTDDSPKYDPSLRCEARILSIAATKPGAVREAVSQGDAVLVVTDRTCFYTEQGGQVGDIGTLECETGLMEVDQVIRRESSAGVSVIHRGHVIRGRISQNQPATLRVQEQRRRRIMQNHTATHVLNWALRETLGDHVQQKGSLVDSEKTRFDFSHPKALGEETLRQIEKLADRQIRDDLTVYADYQPQQLACGINGLRAVFGEKYPDVVRVVSIGPSVQELVQKPDNPDWRRFPIEFCGGTHLASTGQIEDFTLTHEESVAKGIRRVVGITGGDARAARQRARQLHDTADELLAADPAQASAQVGRLQQDVQGAVLPELERIALRGKLDELQKKAKQHEKKAAAAVGDELNARVDALLPQAEKIGETTILVAELPQAPADQLKSAADRVKTKCGSAAVFFGVNTGDKAMLIAGVTDDLIRRGVKAGDWVKQIAPLVEGGGGGPPTMAQAGGKNPAKLAEALAAAKRWITEKL